MSFRRLSARYRFSTVRHSCHSCHSLSAHRRAETWNLLAISGLIAGVVELGRIKGRWQDQKRNNDATAGTCDRFGWLWLLGGCMQSTTLEPASEANFKPRDKQLLAKAPYAKAAIPEPYQRHIVNYHRKEAPGSIVVDADARFLYYVLPMRARRSATASPSAKRRWPSRASPRSAARQSGRPGRRPPTSRSGSDDCRTSSDLARIIRWARARSICSRATRTRSTASTAPTSRNISARRFPRAASA